MPELSSLLRQRLEAGEAPGLAHPDADTLTAYVEQSLTVAERQVVLKHISLCGECRAVVALTLPEAPVAAPEEVAPEEVVAVTAPVKVVPMRRKNWFLSPAFGLAASIAVMAVGLTLILRLPQKQTGFTQPSPAPVQEAKAPAVDAKTGEAKDSAASGQKVLDDAVARAEKPAESGRLAAAGKPLSFAPAERDTHVAMTAQPAKKKSPAEAGTAVLEARNTNRQDYLNNMFAAQAADNAASAPVVQDLPSAPAPTQGGMVFSAPSLLAGNTFQQQNGRYLTVPPNAQPRSQGGFVTFSPPTAERGLLAKIFDAGKRPLKRATGPAIRPESLSNLAMFNSGISSSQAVEAAAAKAENADTGNLADSPAFSAGLRASLARRERAAEDAVAQFQWKVAQGKLLKSADLSHWTEGYPAGEGVEFTVASAGAREIWAGGKHAVLVCSHDGGTSWERVSLGGAATGSIVSIEAGGSILRVTTSTNQVWSTNDGGKTWTLR